MPADNLDTLRRLNQAFNRGDVEEALRYLHPEVELRPGVQVPDEESAYIGHDGMLEWFRSATEPWESIEIEQVELTPLPDDRVLAVERWAFRGRDGIELEVELPTVLGFRDGLVFRIHGFTDVAEARAAAGLAP